MPVRISTPAWLTIRWHDTAGRLVAWDQLTVGSPHRVRADPPELPDAAASRPDPEIQVEPELCLWRAPTDNDGFKLMPDLSRRIGVGGQALVAWQDMGLDSRPAEEFVGHRVSVSEDELGTVYRHTVDVKHDDLPRVGVRFVLPTRFSALQWFGRGPHENYPDRNRSAMMGVWSGPVDPSPYLVPQEHGLRNRLPLVRVHRPGNR